MSPLQSPRPHCWRNSCKTAIPAEWGPCYQEVRPHVVPLQVTGRRLWKNVYDELGGSPGSTSAATCTRRHYERCGWGPGYRTPGPSPPRAGQTAKGLGVVCGRTHRSVQGWGGMGGGVRPSTMLTVAERWWGSRPSGQDEERGPGCGLSCPVHRVSAIAGKRREGQLCLTAWPPVDVRLLLRLVLPYVRHLKGEDDKPLPPSKPRKQYKVAKEPRGDDSAAERPPKATEEKPVGQVSVKPSQAASRPGASIPAAHSCPRLLSPWHGHRHPCPEHSEPVAQIVHYLRAHVGSECQAAPHSLGPVS